VRVYIQTTCIKLIYESTDDIHRQPPPSHVDIHIWPSISLGEISELFYDSLHSHLPVPVIGTRLVYKLISTSSGRFSDGPPGRLLLKDAGSVIYQLASLPAKGVELSSYLSIKDDSSLSLADLRYEAGDSMAVAIIPTLPDGSVAPVPGPLSGGALRGDRSSNFNSRGGLGSRSNGFRTFPGGDWTRGEAPPDLFRAPHTRS
jgi:histone deacetylase complex subunit SAP18